MIKKSILMVVCFFLMVSQSFAQDAEDGPLLLTKCSDAIRIMREYDAPGLIFLTASWCEPCKKLEQELRPMMPALKEHYVIYFVDVDKEPEVARGWKNSGKFSGGVPFYAMLSPGAKYTVGYSEGFKSREQFAAWLKKVCEDTYK